MRAFFCDHDMCPPLSLIRNSVDTGCGLDVEMVQDETLIAGAILNTSGVSLEQRVCTGNNARRSRSLRDTDDAIAGEAPPSTCNALQWQISNAGLIERKVRSSSQCPMSSLKDTAPEALTS